MVRPAASAATEETDAQSIDTAFDDDERDDLMKIDGIGPALQTVCMHFGSKTYAQLASLDDVDIERLERQLDDNEGLNISEWVSQAKELEKR